MALFDDMDGPEHFTELFAALNRWETVAVRIQDGTATKELVPLLWGTLTRELATKATTVVGIAGSSMSADAASYLAANHPNLSLSDVDGGAFQPIRAAINGWRTASAAKRNAIEAAFSLTATVSAEPNGDIVITHTAGAMNLTPFQTADLNTAISAIQTITSKL